MKPPAKRKNTQKGRYPVHTAENLPPAKREEIIELLIKMVDIVVIAKRMKVSVHTVIALARQEAHRLPDWKTKARVILKEFVDSGTRRLDEKIEDIPMGKLPVAVAIAIDKLLVLEGAPTQRIEVTRRTLTPADLAEFIADDAMDVETVDVEPEDEPVRSKPPATKQLELGSLTPTKPEPEKLP